MIGTFFNSNHKRLDTIAWVPNVVAWIVPVIRTIKTMWNLCRLQRGFQYRDH